MSQRALVLAAVATIAGANVARAQFSADVQRGQRVRVWVPESYAQANSPAHRLLLRGTVDDVAADTLRLSVPGTLGALAIPRASIRRLDISRGKPSRIASMLERGIGGAIVTGLVFAATNAIYTSSDNFSTQYDSNWDAALAGAAWGGGIGAAFGLVWPTERWRRLRLR